MPTAAWWLVTRSKPRFANASRADAHEAFYDGTMQGAPVRIVELEVAADPAAGRPPAVVRVAETEGKRNALAREILLNVLAPQVLLILIAGIVVWVGVVRGLAPLERLQRAVAQRSHLDRSPVVADDVPGEVGPLVRVDQRAARAARQRPHAAEPLRFGRRAPVEDADCRARRRSFELAQREKDPERIQPGGAGAVPGAGASVAARIQLLSLARNEPEAVHAVPMTPLDLNALALEVAAGWVPEALKQGVDLGLEGSVEPAMIAGNAGRLRELLDNLLDNAILYGGRAGGGRVTVRVSAVPQPAVAVSDDGPGIPAQERERVFERFHRLVGSPGDGSGLGLAIAREIARIHGATLTLEEPAGSTGNTFTVAFPPAIRRA